MSDEPIGNPPTGHLAFEEDPRKLVRTATESDRAAPHPIYCVWEITLACDLGCRHCGSRAADERPGELSLTECLDVVRQLDEIGIREVTLIGGEAYLRDDWDQIAADITRRGMVCSITTGARSLTQDRVDRAAAAGVSTISISIDGLERTHDAQRGVKGSWRAAVEAAERVSASPIRLTTNTQINRLSLPELPGIADLMIRVGSKAWQLALTVAMGRGADRPDLLLDPHQLLEVFPLLVWLKRNKLTPNGIKMFPGNNIGYFGPYERELRYGGDRGAHWSSCSAGKWSMGLEADGTIKGCPSLPPDRFGGGTIRELPIATAMRDAEPIRHVRERSSDDLWGFCKTCYYADVCKAGCTWTSHCLLGRAGNNPYCIHRAVELEKGGERERIRKLGPAPGRPFDHGLFEIIREPIPDEPTETIAGLPLDRVLGLSADDGTVWDRSDILAALRER